MNIQDSVLLVSAASLIFALGYMRDDRRKLRFFFLMILFTLAMELFLIAEDWLTLYFSWELMTLCSYFLIGHYETERARRAARKAFLLTRVGSAALLLAIAYTFSHTGTFAIGEVSRVAAVLIFIAALSKASQFPFSWLPDAMEAPTPASALLHAATMVNAGPILLHRLSSHFIFLKPGILFSSYLTLVLASLSAIQENNLKRVLAYSTIASLAILFFFFDSPLFLPFFLVHSFSKASLFFIAGELSHHRGYDIEMGYSRRSLQALLFLIFSLSIAGFPPFGAFWIKATELSVFSALSFLLSLTYFFRAYLKVFSGNMFRSIGYGSIPALFLLPFSIIPTLPLVSFQVVPALLFLLLSIFTYVLLQLEPLFSLFEKIFNLVERIDLRVLYLEEIANNVVYRAGVNFQRAALSFRRVFTGPVSRDVAYIAISLVLLILGVILSQT